ncbi:hypothetical protein [Planktothrix agardhii]|uniref:hypothetical protein n=1 Tax=Planktothrix agardhii TaxID=1160 RepID=UPI0020A74507|nr:hypothetical protein [Planktothrix agardhii]CAD5953991.1 hypothetical protein NO758_02716 [Planktothrix agardhii]
MLKDSRPWRSNVAEKYKQELQELKQLPLCPTHAPVLIGTAAGYFEIAWNMKKDVLMVWATSNTWEYILRKVVSFDQSTHKPYVDEEQKELFLQQIGELETTLTGTNKPFLRAYPSSLLRKFFRRLKPWKDEPIINNFGSWVELSCLLPSYIEWRFGPELQAAGNRGQEQLGYVQKYATQARKLFDERGQLVGFGVGDSGLWLGGNSIHRPDRNFRLIWGLGGRSDFAIRVESNDGVKEIEYWDLKTRSFSKRVNSPNQLISNEDIQQVTRQAPMQLIYRFKDQPPLPNMETVNTIGIICVGCDSDGKVISNHESVNKPTEEERIFDRNTNTIRTDQWYEQLGNPERVKLAATVLGDAANRLVNNLMGSDEWDAIRKELDEYWKRKYLS